MIESIEYYIERLSSNGKLKLIISLLLTPILNHLTSLEDTAKALLILIAIDWLLGLSIAFLRRNISSKSSFSGLFKFVLYFFAYYSMLYLDQIVFGGRTHFGFTNLITIYLGLTEAISILENISTLSRILNIRNPVPPALLEKLKITQEGLFDSKQKIKDLKGDNSGKEEN